MAMNFKSQNVDKKEWEESLEKLAYLSYEDQCSPANPRVPMIKDMIELMRAAYEGTEIHYEQH
jgi:aldehyde-alcohol dehydrogenase 2